MVREPLLLLLLVLCLLPPGLSFMSRPSCVSITLKSQTFSRHCKSKSSNRSFLNMAPPEEASAADAAAPPPHRDVDDDSSLSSPPAAKKQKTTAQSSMTSFFQVKKSPKKNGQEENNNENEAVAAGSSSKQEDTTASAGDANKNKEDSPADSYDAIIPTSVPFSNDASWIVYKDACIVRKLRTTNKSNRCNAASSSCAAFDLDGTLLAWRISGWPSRLEHYELWNTNVIDKMRDLYDNQGYQLLIISNQGAIRSAHNGKKATHVKSLLEWLISTIDRPVSVVMSTNKKLGYHKPSPNMWAVAEEVCNRGEPFDVSSSFFVGDSIETDDDPQGGVDVGFARKVGELKGAKLQFCTPEEYFGPSNAELRKKMSKLAYDEPSAEVLATRAALTSGYLQSPILLILVGAQGSGKSTFCNQLVDNNSNNDSSHWVHLSQDTINNGKPGKREAVEEAAEAALQNKQSVVVDRMHLDETQRAYFVHVAKDSGVPAHCVVLSPPKEVVEQRVRERENHEGGVQGDAGAKLAANSTDKLVLPKYEEGLALITVASSSEAAARVAALYRIVCDSSKTSSIPTSFKLSSNVALPSMALGTMGLGRKQAGEVAAKASELGFEAFDTAPTYKNEDKIGEAGFPSSSFCIVKIPKRATSAAQVRQELSESLSKLKRKHADLLLLHWPSDVIATESLGEVWAAMEACLSEGLVRALGVCNFNVQALLMLLSKCKVRPSVNQVERHILLPQWDLVDFCAQHDIVLQAHTALGQGSDTLLKHDVVKDVASRSNMTAAQVVLKWNLQQGVAVVPKCSTEEHMRDVLAARTGPALPATDMEALNGLKESNRFVAPPFMYGKEPYCWGERMPN